MVNFLFKNTLYTNDLYIYNISYKYIIHNLAHQQIADYLQYKSKIIKEKFLKKFPKSQ